MKHKITLIASLLFLTTSAQAAEPTVMTLENRNLNANFYWNAERLKNAKPMPLPKADPKKMSQALQKNPGVNQDFHAPTFKMTPINKPLFKTEIETTAPNDHGNRYRYFSSSQLVPVSADLSFPYSTVGRLYFYDPTRGDMYCTATVINKRVIVTAGHCLHNGSGSMSGFYDRFTFIPAYRDGYAPYQSWNWSFAAVSSSWFYSGARMPNDADYGMLELQNNYIDGNYRSIASITGSMGYSTLSLAPNHAHILGYSRNFDGGQKLHQVTAQSGNVIEANNVEFGSDMDNGSSGSPVIQNFGLPANGQSGGLNPGFNRIIGIIAWGTTAPGSMTEGASNPDYRFVEVLNKICAHNSDSCF